MTDVSDIETDFASPAKMGDKITPERVSRGASLAAKVEITQSRFSEVTLEGEVRPDTLQKMAALGGIVSKSLTRILKKGLMYDVVEENAAPLA
jgi:coenzyme F420-reducing hydrogenase beta subunit